MDASPTARHSSGPHARLLLAAVLILGVLVVRQQTLRMDWIFFQPSWAGIRGLVLYLAGDYGGAARAYRGHFRERVAAGESFGDPMLEILLGGHLDEAERAAKASLRGGWSANAALTLGEVALQRGRANDAAGFFRTVLDREPDHVDALLLISVAYTRGDDPGRAIDALNRALRHNHVGSRVTGFLWILETTGDLEKRALDQRPVCLLAHAYRYLRVFDPSNAKWAIERAKQAIARGDRAADAYLTLGIVHDKQGQQEEALGAFAEATRRDPRLAEGYRRAALVYAGRGDLANEYRMIRAAFEAAPADPFYLYDLNRVLTYRLGDLPAVVEVMGRALTVSPDNLRAHQHLAYATAVLGDEPRALAHYRRAIELDPTDPTSWEGLGWTFARLKRDDDGIAAYRRAAALAPRRHEPHRGLARLYNHQRRFREAIGEYEAALRLGDPTIDTLVWLCVARVNVSEFDRAAACFRAVLTREPGNTVAQRYLHQTENNARLQRAGR
jgi:tetratricopeptide (TPR) repeat protein